MSHLSADLLEDRLALHQSLANAKRRGNTVLTRHVEVTTSIVEALDAYLDPCHPEHVREAKRRASTRDISRSEASRSVITDSISLMSRYIACALRRDGHYQSRHTGEAVKGLHRKARVGAVCHLRLCPFCDAGQSRHHIAVLHAERGRRKVALMVLTEDEHLDHLSYRRHHDVHVRRVSRLREDEGLWRDLAESGAEILSTTTEVDYGWWRRNIHTTVVVALDSGASMEAARARTEESWTGGIVTVEENHGRAIEYAMKALRFRFAWGNHIVTNCSDDNTSPTRCSQSAEGAPTSGLT